MNTQGQSGDQRLVDYLLGALSEDEQRQVEQSYFADDALHEQLVVLEDELLADYARGTLSPDLRKRVEDRLLISSANRDRVAVLEALWQSLDTPAAKSSVARGGVPQWLFAAAAVIAIAGASWLVMENARLRDRLRQSEGGRAQLEALLDQQKSPAPESAAATPATAPVLALSLAAGLTRDSGSTLPTVRVTDPNAILEITMALPENVDEPVYFVSIRNPDDQQVWSGNREPSAGGPLVLRVPASALPPNDYEIRLHRPSGRSTSLTEYYFGIRQ